MRGHITFGHRAMSPLWREIFQKTNRLKSEDLCGIFAVVVTLQGIAVQSPHVEYIAARPHYVLQ